MALSTNRLEKNLLRIAESLLDAELLPNAEKVKKIIQQLLIY